MKYITAIFKEFTVLTKNRIGIKKNYINGHIEIYICHPYSIGPGKWEKGEVLLPS
jgi:hypothetical protein